MCVLSRMSEVSQVEKILFSKRHFWSEMINIAIVQVFARFGKFQGLFGFAMGNFGSTSKSLHDYI